MDIILDSPFFLWYLLSAVFIIFEMVTGGSIVFLFLGLSCFTSGIILQNELLAINSFFEKSLLFLCLFCFYSLILWYPIKSLSFKKKIKKNINLKGETAVVASQTLDNNSIGRIKWSGTLCKARLHKEDSTPLSKNDVVQILSVENNTFIVEKK